VQTKGEGYAQKYKIKQSHNVFTLPDFNFSDMAFLILFDLSSLQAVGVLIFILIVGLYTSDFLFISDFTPVDLSIFHQNIF
jgi:hypothetical protein